MACFSHIVLLPQVILTDTNQTEYPGDTLCLVELLLPLRSEILATVPCMSLCFESHT